MRTLVSPLIGALAALAVAGCSRPPLGEGLPDTVKKGLEPCIGQSGSVRDHCAVTISTQLDLTGAEWMTLCGQLDRGTAYELCVERAAWAPREPAPFSVCANIREERTRQSCLLGATNAIIEGPIAALVDVCARTEALEDDCWVHVSTERRNYWLGAGSQKVFEDVSEAVKLRPRLAESVPFASEVGRIESMNVRSYDTGVCTVFAAQVPQMTCINNSRGGFNPGAQ